MTDHEVWDEGPPITSPLHEANMPRGWPRPRARDGLPVPYIASEPDRLGVVEPMRQYLCVADHRCQVCGELLSDTCVVVAGPGSVLVIDGAGIHPTPCWAVARRLCPQLATMASAGTLRVWTIRTDDLVLENADSGTSGYLVPDVPPDGAASIELTTPV